MFRKIKAIFILLFFFCTTISGCASWNNSPEFAAKKITTNSVDTVQRFREHKDLKEFEKFLKQAHAVMIFPEVVKAGLFYGGEVGNGVLLKRLRSGGWSHPSFVTLGAASWGLQLGVQETAIILVLMNEGALESVLNYQGKLGADTGATMGLWGLGMEASVTTNMQKDILAFANANVGAYLGLSLEGAVIARRRDLNESIYGKGATPEKILSGEYENKEINNLREVLGQY